MEPTSTPATGPSTVRPVEQAPSLPSSLPRQTGPSTHPQTVPQQQQQQPALVRPPPPAAPGASPAPHSASSQAQQRLSSPVRSNALPPAPHAPLHSVAGPSSAPLPAPARPPPEQVPWDAHRPGQPLDEAKLITEGVRLRVFLKLALDQHKAFAPDVSPFRDHADVLDRLLPYYVWQVPEDDLNVPLGAPSCKGKGRARDWDAPESEEQERAELKQAMGFVKRFKRIEERFARVREREGVHASPSDMSICLSREVVNDFLPQITKTRNEQTQARHRHSVLTSQANQLRNPTAGPSSAAGRPPASGPQQGYYRPPQGYPSTPIYRPAPGGGTYQASRPLAGYTPNPPSARPPSNPVGRPPSVRPLPYGPPAGTPGAAAGSTPARPPPPGRPPAPLPAQAHPPPPSIASGTASAAPSTAKAINIHAPHSLSVPLAFMPNLRAAGILPDDTASPPTPGLATDVVIDRVRDTARFTVVLAKLPGDRIKTLSEVLNLAHGGDASKPQA